MYRCIPLFPHGEYGGLSVCRGKSSQRGNPSCEEAFQGISELRRSPTSQMVERQDSERRGSPSSPGGSPSYSDRFIPSRTGGSFAGSISFRENHHQASHSKSKGSHDREVCANFIHFLCEEQFFVINISFPAFLKRPGLICHLHLSAKSGALWGTGINRLCPVAWQVWQLVPDPRAILTCQGDTKQPAEPAEVALAFPSRCSRSQPVDKNGAGISLLALACRCRSVRIAIWELQEGAPARGADTIQSA